MEITIYKLQSGTLLCYEIMICYQRMARATLCPIRSTVKPMILSPCHLPDRNPETLTLAYHQIGTDRLFLPNPRSAGI